MTKASTTTITAQRLAALTAAADGTAREIEALEAKLRAIALRKRAIAERAVEENAAADAAAALARAAAQKAAREELPSREEQAFIDAEIGKSEEQQAWLERQVSDAARRRAVAAAPLPSPLSAAQERWLGVEVERHVSREAAAAAAVAMTRLAASEEAGKPARDEQEWVEAEMGKAEEEAAWFERQASEAEKRVAVLRSILAERGGSSASAPLAAALPSPVSLEEERWLRHEAEQHAARQGAAAAAVETALSLEAGGEAARDSPSAAEQAWMLEEQRKLAEQGAWLERQASESRRRSELLRRATGRTPPPPQRAGLSATAQPFEPPAPLSAAAPGAKLPPSPSSAPSPRRPFDRPLQAGGTAAGGTAAVPSARATLAHRAAAHPIHPPSAAQPAGGAIRRALADLHRTREQMGALRALAAEATEAVEAMRAGSLEPQPHLKRTLVQLQQDAASLLARGRSALGAMAAAGPSASASASEAEHVLSLAVQTLREELASLLTAYAEMEAERGVAHA